MKMTTTFLQSELWNKIDHLAKRAKRKHIAVAYLGSGASNLIPLSKGDTLVIDLSLQAAKSGQTNPHEVAKYIRAGASVFSCANLHAKVYLFDKTSVVGSGNLSLHSRNALVEAGIVTNDSTVLKSARGFIKSIQVEPVTPEYLKLCKREYRPPKFGGGVRGNRKRRDKRVLPTYSRLWLSGVFDATFSDEEERISERENRRALREVKDKRKYEVDSVRWVGESHITRTARKGDFIVQIYNDKVYPPFRIVRISKYQLPNRKSTRYFLHIEEDKRPKLFRWSKFKKTLSQVGLGKLTPLTTREIKSPKASHTILGLWS